MAIDIQNVAAPRVLQRLDVIGQLDEGTSRKIGDTIYVVSHQRRGYYSGWRWQQSSGERDRLQAWAYSFNVADPKNLKLVDQLKIFEGGDGNTSEADSGTRKRRYFNSLTLSATANALLVAENWNTYESVQGSPYKCGSSRSQQQAVVSVIDISDAHGDIKLHTRFETYGAVTDQFKHTYIHDPGTGKGHYLGLFARREWQWQDCTGTSHIENNLEVWDVTNGKSPARVGKLPFGKPDETVRGSVFDPERKVAFAITAENVDPLYAISFANPSKPAVLSEVDGLSGDMNVFRFIGGRKFLIGIGRDNSSTCTGFGSPTTGWSSNVAVSVIDVQDLSKIRLVQRRCVTVSDASWVGSEVNWNLDQAHKVLGMHSDGLKNVISVPVHYTRKQPAGSWFWYRRETAVGLMSWDLGKYDPLQDHLNQSVLVNHGTVVHPQGEVRRSVVFSHQASGSRRKMINLSNTHMAITDIEDLDSPGADSQVEIAPYQAGLHRFGGYLVERIGQPWGSDQPTEFRVKKAGAGLEQAEVLAAFTVPGRVQKTVSVGDNLVVFRRQVAKPAPVPGPGAITKPAPGRVALEAVVYGLSDPTRPRLLATVPLPVEYLPYAGSRCGVPSYPLSGGFGLAVSGDRIVILKRDYAQNQPVTSLVFVDLTVPASPVTYEETLPASKDRDYLDLLAAPGGKGVFLNYKDRVGELTVGKETFDRVKYYAQLFRPMAHGWYAGMAVSVPGRLARSWTARGTALLLTHDKIFDMLEDGSFRESTRLNLLRAPFGLFAFFAELLDSRAFYGRYLKDLVLARNTLFVNSRPQYTFRRGPVPLSGYLPRGQGPDELGVFKVARRGRSAFGPRRIRLVEAFQGSLGTDSVQLMGVHKQHLFVNMPGDGIMTVNVAKPTAPRGEHFLRTLGFAEDIEFHGNMAYVPTGHYGVNEIDLGGGATLTLN